MNRAMIVGRIASDPESRKVGEASNCSFRVAVQRRYANAQGVREADFLQVVCWRQSADFVQKYMHKGDRIAVEGSIQARSYDAQDGSKRHVVEIVADNVESLQGRNESQQQGGEKEFKPLTDEEMEGLPF